MEPPNQTVRATSYQKDLSISFLVSDEIIAKVRMLFDEASEEVEKNRMDVR